MAAQGTGEDFQQAMQRNNAAILQAVTNLMDEKFRDFKRSSEDSADKQLVEIKKMKTEQLPKFKRKGNEEQYNSTWRYNRRWQELRSLSRKGRQEKRQKLILLADKSDNGWTMVQEYVKNDLASDSEDEKRIAKVEYRAKQKKKEKQKAPKSPAERVRIHSTDLLCRIHRAREDSGQNEAERLNASMGDAICDGGTIRWEHFSPIHGLAEEDLSKMTTSSLQAHREQMTEKNAWTVAEEIKLRIDDSPAPSGFTQAFIVEHPGSQFFFNWDHLLRYMKTAKTLRTSLPGYHYFTKIEVCQESRISVISAPTMTSSGQHLNQSRARPYPDYDRLPEFHYLPYDKTPCGARPPDNYQPRAQLKAADSDIDEVVLELGTDVHSDSNTEEEEEAVSTNTNSISRFGRRRQQKVLNPDYILW
ncbi:hypothetical protein Bbelb_052430 [Branchiostoma belcheri]|nr:hypothetical protein Bbelb_052430 [Branchiostoma belcheri]